LRILVVEDDERLGREIAVVLRRADYAVDLVAEGIEAGFLAETEPYDAIVLDLGLPDRDGLEVLKELRAKKISTPVLILTARDRFSDMVVGFRAGADEYMNKPFRVDELVSGWLP
jgi:two-component system OmpR family response regulator